MCDNLVMVSDIGT